jgi:WD40 repeat protein
MLIAALISLLQVQVWAAVPVLECGELLVPLAIGDPDLGSKVVETYVKVLLHGVESFPGVFTEQAFRQMSEAGSSEPRLYFSLPDDITRGPGNWSSYKAALAQLQALGEEREILEELAPELEAALFSLRSLERIDQGKRAQARIQIEKPNPHGLIIKVSSSMITAIKFTSDGKRLLASTHEGYARIYNLFGRTLRTLNGSTRSGHMPWCTYVDITPDGERIVTSHHDASVRLWARDGTLLKEFQLTYQGVFSPDGSKVWLSRLKQAFDREGKLIGELEEISDLGAYSGDGQIFASARGTQVTVYDATIRPLETPLEHPGRRVGAVAVSYDGSSIMTGDANQKNRHGVFLWKQDGTLIGKHFEHGGGIYYASISRQGDLGLTLSYDDTARLWNLDPTQIDRPRRPILRVGDEKVNAAIFSPSGVITGGSSGVLRVWDRTGKQGLSIPGHDEISSLAVSPDEKILAVGTKSGKIHLWELSQL